MLFCTTTAIYFLSPSLWPRLIPINCCVFVFVFVQCVCVFVYLTQWGVKVEVSPSLWPRLIPIKCWLCFNEISLLTGSSLSISNSFGAKSEMAKLMLVHFLCFTFVFVYLRAWQDASSMNMMFDGGRGDGEHWCLCICVLCISIYMCVLCIWRLTCRCKEYEYDVWRGSWWWGTLMLMRWVLLLTTKCSHAHFNVMPKISPSTKLAVTLVTFMFMLLSWNLDMTSRNIEAPGTLLLLLNVDIYMHVLKNIQMTARVMIETPLFQCYPCYSCQGKPVVERES